MVKLDYANGVKDVLIRKINKAERELEQLKLDYCRFVYGLSHRTIVMANGRQFQVRNVDLKSMRRLDSGEWSRPVVSGVPVDENGRPAGTDLITLAEWRVV